MSTTEVVTLKSDDAEVVINPQHGARLSSFVRLRAGSNSSEQRFELLWRGTEHEYVASEGEWVGGAPWLFPAVGQNFASSTSAGCSFAVTESDVRSIECHGFLQDCAFDVLSSSPQRCVLRYSSKATEEWPWAFEVRVCILHDRFAQLLTPIISFAHHFR